jgi:hypothetical protein
MLCLFDATKRLSSYKRQFRRVAAERVVHPRLRLPWVTEK